MALELVATDTFALAGKRYSRGAHITDPTLIKQALAEHPTHVVRRAARPVPVVTDAPKPLASAAELAAATPGKPTPPAADGAAKK